MNQHPYLPKADLYPAARYFPSQLPRRGSRARRRKENEQRPPSSRDFSAKPANSLAILVSKPPEPRPDSGNRTVVPRPEMKVMEERRAHTPKSRSKVTLSSVDTSKISTNTTAKKEYWKDKNMASRFQENGLLSVLRDYTYGGDALSAFRIHPSQDSGRRSSSESSCSSFGVCQRFKMDKEQGTDPTLFYTYDTSNLPRPESPTISSSSPSDFEGRMTQDSEDEEEKVEDSYEEYKRITDVFNSLKVSSPSRWKSCLGLSKFSKRNIPKPRFPSSLIQCLFQNFCSIPLSKNLLEAINDCCDQYFKQMVQDLENHCAKEGRKVITEEDMGHMLKVQRETLRKEVEGKLMHAKPHTLAF